MALYFECRINKNALLQSVFLAILFTGKEYTNDMKVNNCITYPRCFAAFRFVSLFNVIGRFLR